ncbi:uncharacterized protein BJ212DRAFT_1361072, partial [Suillus subaureus]
TRSKCTGVSTVLTQPLTLCALLQCLIGMRQILGSGPMDIIPRFVDASMSRTSVRAPVYH